MSEWHIITSEAGDCKCGTQHEEGESLWTGFITKRAAETELSTVTNRKHSVALEVEKQTE